VKTIVSESHTLAQSKGIPAVRLHNVSFSYHRRPRTPPIHVLENLSFDVADGQFVAVVGPSGCGKTTLLKLVAGLLTPTTGAIDVAQTTSSRAQTQHKIGFVFQEPALLKWRTVRRNVQLPDELTANTESKKDIDALLRALSLEPFSDRYPEELSGGMRQKVALARALNCTPGALLMDEPYGAVDELTRMKLNDDLLQVWSKSRLTVLFVTHSVIEAAYLADRVIILSERPAHIKSIMDVPFSRPRYRALRTEFDFVSFAQRISATLGNET
jgi:NitT/TauT family transport system ATP-binding protein